MFAEEEKREARAKKEEDRTRKLEEKRLRDAEKQKVRDEKTTPKTVAGAAIVATATEPTVTEPEAPTLEPTPHVASMAPAEKLQNASTDSKEDLVRGDEKRLDPTFLPMSEKSEITASQANLPSGDAAGSDLEPMVTAESDTSPNEVGVSGNAEEIARRVFAAPVDNEDSEKVVPPPANLETTQLVDATSNIQEAPVVKHDDVASTVAESESTLATAPQIEKTTPAKHDLPVTSRIAPPIAAAGTAVATTETTVSGPSASVKAKETKGVSSWLKTKFGRRSSKATKPENVTSTGDVKEKGFVGGANLTAPEASNPQSNQGNSSMRELAMAGKEPAAEPAMTAPALTPIVSPNDDDLYSASTHSRKGPGGMDRLSTSSPSISSLSSDEDTRGRSAIPRDREPLSQAEFLKSELESGKHVDPDLVPGKQIDPALLKRHEKGQSSSDGKTEDFEEARDTFDSERLNPPDRGIVRSVGDSPARDSKFLEDL